jgi:transcriptional activator for dhaKLM operon
MQRETWQAPHQAQGLTFESICRRKTALLTIAQAALEDAWEFMDGRPCALFILDESACILSRCGDPQTVEQLAELGFRDGSYCAESIIGSCALSLATMPGQPTKPLAISILNRRCIHGRSARRRCSITMGVCSAPSLVLSGGA